MTISTRFLSIALAACLSAVALAGCAGNGSSDEQRDTDGDGLSDAVERAERSVEVQTANGTQTLRVTSDTDAADTDGDGLDDLNEYGQRTNPREPDTDGDGLLDGFNQTLESGDARAEDWRARGILEGPPLTFWGELSFCRDYGGLKPTFWSSDRPIADNLGDGEELVGWNITVKDETRHVTSDPCTQDADQDGARDHQEREWGTDPRWPDTDGDGVPDGTDVQPLWDLRLEFSDIRVEGVSGTVVVSAVDMNARIEPGATGRIEVDIPEQVPQSSTHDRHEFRVLMFASDGTTGEPVRLFPGGADIILTLMAIRGELHHGEQLTEEPVTFTGEDGSISFSWEILRE